MDADDPSVRSIHARWVATAVVDEPPVLEDQVILVDNGRITGIVPRQSFDGEPDVSLPTHIVIPGLVNCHTHTPMALLRGYADDLPLQDWLFQHIFPTEGRFVFESGPEVGKEFVRRGSELAVYEMLRTGTTLFNDMYFYGDVTADVVRQAGLRAVLAPMGLLYLGNDDMFAGAVKANTDWCKTLIEEGHDRVYPSLIPHSAYMVPEEKLQFAKSAYDETFGGKKFVMHTHVHETKKEVDDLFEKTGTQATRIFDKLDMLNSSAVCAHCVHLTDEEIELFATRGVSVAHNPRSNLKLGSGIAPVGKMLAAGVNVCLGTDGAASNNSLDMLSEMQFASFLAKGATCDPTVVPAAQALRMATINGARALGLDQEVGSLAVGKAADIVAVDLGHVEVAPIFDPLGALVFTNRREVSHVWVNGRCLVQDGTVRTLSLDMEKIDELLARIHDFRKTLPGRESPTSMFSMSLCRCCALSPDQGVTALRCAAQEKRKEKPTVEQTEVPKEEPTKGDTCTDA